MSPGLDYELKVIADKGYSPYFLVVYDLLRFAEKTKFYKHSRVCCGSLVTYLLRITNVDPFVYKLPFERFLNPERPSAPDIDMDYADTRRDEVIDYARRKYGIDNVAQIGTFGTMMARGAVKDVARAMKYPYVVGDRISKMIPPPRQGFPVTIAGALQEVPEQKNSTIPIVKCKPYSTWPSKSKAVHGIFLYTPQVRLFPLHHCGILRQYKGS